MLVRWPPVVESSIAVEGAVENRGLYRVSVSPLFSFRTASTGSPCAHSKRVLLGAEPLTLLASMLEMLYCQERESEGW